MHDIPTPRPTLGTMRRVSALAVVIVSVVVACSSDPEPAASTAPSDPAASETPLATEAPAAASAPATTNAPVAPAAASDPAAPDFGSGTGSITLGEETFVLAIGPGTGLCRDVFGIIQAGGQVTDGRDIEGAFMIPPLDWEADTDGRYDPPSVELEITSTGDDNASWRADAAWAEENDKVGSSQVDAYEKDGLTASGTATFSNAWDLEAESVQGSFEVSCAGA